MYGRLPPWLPPWFQDWLALIVPVVQVVIILLVAWALRRLVRRLFDRLGERYNLTLEMVLGGRRAASFVIYVATLLLVLERVGVSGTVLWSAFTGFAAVAAVAFFAAWSVLSNIFCTLLIFTTRLFRLHDNIELLESTDKAGFRGRVVDINLVFTTVHETGSPPGAVLQVPNSLFFQRAVRRWQGDPPPPPPDIAELQPRKP